MEIWNGSKVRSYGSFADFNTSSPLYSRHVQRDLLSFHMSKWPNTGRSHGKMTGFFVPPHTGMFQFLVKIDDVGRLFMSDSESPLDKV